MFVMSASLFAAICAVHIVLAESTQYIDIGREFDEKTIYWTNVQPFTFTKKISGEKPDGTWYAANEFMAGEHGGTHLDAPYHFYKDGWKVGGIPITNLIVPGVLMDMRSEVKNNPDFILKPQHIKEWIEQHGNLPDGGILLIRFGWGAYYKNKTNYFGIDRSGMIKHFPGLAADTAEYLTKQFSLVGVGTDTPSVDLGTSTFYPAHIWLQTHNMYILENLNLEIEMPEIDFTLIVMPMKITEGTGAPCRVVAMVNNSSTVQISMMFMVILFILSELL